MECALFRKDYDNNSCSFFHAKAASAVFMECALFRKDYDVARGKGILIAFPLHLYGMCLV